MQQRDQQQQQQQVEKFTALGFIQLYNNDMPIKVTFNVKTNTIEHMEIARELIQEELRKNNKN